MANERLMLLRLLRLLRLSMLMMDLKLDFCSPLYLLFGSRVQGKGYAVNQNIEPTRSIRKFDLKQ